MPQVASADGASPPPTVTYSTTVTVPAPPSSNFSGASAGGDGWAVALSSTQVFNVFHHDAVLGVNCHNQSDASDCYAAPKTITGVDPFDASTDNFATSIGPGLFLDQATGHMFVPVTRESGVTETNLTGGVACIDTTQPTSTAGPGMFCGFTPLTAPGDAPLVSVSGLSAPVQVGSNWYMFNEVSGTPSGTEDQLLCFNLDTDTACPGQPYPVAMGGATFSGLGYSYPIGVMGTDIVLQIAGASDSLACFDTTTNGACAGSWPVTVPSAAGAPFPMLDADGNVVGICDPVATDPCFDMTGASVATPSGMAAAIGQTVQYNGPAMTIGARVYVPNANTDQVDCYDYSLSAECANFPKSFTNLGLLYTVNPDPQRPTCIWVNADNGAEQIQNFDAFSGGPCGTGPVRVLSSDVVVPNSACIPTSYASIQVLQPAPSGYVTGTVDFQDASGNPIPGFAPHNLDSTGTTSLSDLALSTRTALPQFVITLSNPSPPLSTVIVKLVWTGTYSPTCTTSSIVASGVPTSPPPVTTPFKTPVGYWTVARDGGVFTFGGNVPGSPMFFGSLANGRPLTAPITGMARTPDGQGYWVVGADGNVYTFGDAANFGSMEGKHVNGPVVGIASTPTGKGYLLAGADGAVYTFGDAHFFGSMGGTRLNGPVVGVASTVDGQGYWLAGADGAVYAFGDAHFFGSMGGTHLNAPIVAIAATPDAKGYTLVATDGGVFAFGDAVFRGSMGGTRLNAPIVGMATAPDGGGYWEVATDGGVFAFGSAPFFGSMGGKHLNGPMDGIAPFGAVGSH